MFCFFWRVPWGILLKLRQISIPKYIHLQSPWKLRLLANSGSKQQNVFSRFTWRGKNIVKNAKDGLWWVSGFDMHPLGAHVSMYQEDGCFMPSLHAVPSKRNKPRKNDDNNMTTSHRALIRDPRYTLESRHYFPHFTKQGVESQRPAFIQGHTAKK